MLFSSIEISDCESVQNIVWKKLIIKIKLLPIKAFLCMDNTCLQSLLLFQQIQLLNDVINLFLQFLNCSIV